MIEVMKKHATQTQKKRLTNQNAMDINVEMGNALNNLGCVTNLRIVLMVVMKKSVIHRLNQQLMILEIAMSTTQQQTSQATAMKLPTTTIITLSNRSLKAMFFDILSETTLHSSKF